MGIQEAEVACEVFSLLFPKRLILRRPFESKRNIQGPKIKRKSKPRKNRIQNAEMEGIFPIGILFCFVLFARLVRCLGFNNEDETLASHQECCQIKYKNPGKSECQIFFFFGISMF